MPSDISAVKTVTTLPHWLFGIGLTSWRYMWRTTPMRRVEMDDESPSTNPPELPGHLDLDGVRGAEKGVGVLYHRRYSVRVEDAQISTNELMQRLQDDPNLLAPTEFARFHKVGDEAKMRFGDDYVVHMPGPWNGPVRVADVTPRSFRLVTREGHLEAGQIEFAASQDPMFTFKIESWARSGDWASRLLYDRLRMAKEIQTHMWTSALERVVRVAGGRRSGRISIETARIAPGG
jgi:Domain of unknown function (DUF1990)